MQNQSSIRKERPSIQELREEVTSGILSPAEIIENAFLDQQRKKVNKVLPMEQEEDDLRRAD